MILFGLKYNFVSLSINRRNLNIIFNMDKREKKEAEKMRHSIPDEGSLSSALFNTVNSIVSYFAL